MGRDPRLRALHQRLPARGAGRRLARGGPGRALRPRHARAGGRPRVLRGHRPLPRRRGPRGRRLGLPVVGRRVRGRARLRRARVRRRVLLPAPRHARALLQTPRAPPPLGAAHRGAPRFGSVRRRRGAARFDEHRRAAPRALWREELARAPRPQPGGNIPADGLARRHAEPPLPALPAPPGGRGAAPRAPRALGSAVPAVRRVAGRLVLAAAAGEDIE
mmetsp:Transcript_23144/g.71539  ORF Transcript_23144/g.71539 Transcript_23144/m.71539 type:complete len:218 (+) Transcript_23144:364-1017(+)